MTTKSWRAERMLGRKVVAANNRIIGRLEELRAERRGTHWFVTEFVIGPAGLLERLGVGAGLVLGLPRKPSGYVARWNQLDLRNVERPRLTCRLDELRKL